MRARLLIAFFLACAVGNSQRIVTVAGLPSNHRADIDGRDAVSAPLAQVYGLLLDRITGRILIHDQTLVERLEPDGTLIAIAGIGRTGDGEITDGAPASSLRTGILRGMAQDAAGALYLADAVNGLIFRIAPDGTFTRFAGGGHGLVGTGDGGPATDAYLASPRGMVFDSRGNLMIAEAICRCIRRVDPAGVIFIVYSLPPAAAFNYFEGLAIDSKDNLYAAEFVGHQVLKIAADGSVTAVAGTGVAGFSGDGGPALDAQLQGPSGVAVLADGTLYIADTANNRIRKITPDGIISTIAGTGVRGFAGDGGPAIAANLAAPAQVLPDSSGNLYVSDFMTGRVRKISAGGIITTVAGNGDIGHVALPFPPVGDGGPALNAVFNLVPAVASDAAGNLFVADFLGNRIRKIGPDGVVATIAGTGARGASGDGGPAVQATLDGPVGLTVDGHGSLYISTGDSRVRKIDSSGIITLVAGTGTGLGPVRSQGDGGLATAATLNEPKQLAVDAAGNVYIADTSNARLRRVDLNGVIQTVAGPGQQGVDYWNGVALDARGNVFIATTHAASAASSQVQRVNSDGGLTPAAGNGQPCSGPNAEFPYDGAQALQIPLCIVTAITFDPQGMLYISEPYYGAVLRMAPDGTITRVAGRLLALTGGDGGLARNASLSGDGASSPGAVAVDTAGNLFIPQALANRIREVAVAPLTLRLATDAINWQGAQTQVVGVTTNFTDPLPYLVRIQADGGWLTANRASGQTGESLTLTGNPAGLAPGVYRGAVTVTIPGPAPLESSIAVTLTVR